jgi:xeroderma pigmentosum group C-complementing protein
MLADAIPTQSDIPDRPLKKRRTGRRHDPIPKINSGSPIDPEEDEDEEDLQFEDVPVLSKGKGRRDSSSFSEYDEPHKQQQTAYRDSGDESEESDFDWEAINFESNTKSDEPSGDLELNLTTKAVPQRRTATPRRKVVSKEDRALRLQIHKMHVLCLLSYVDRRHNWCNDTEVQKSLKPLLNKKMLTYLRPRSDLSQFGQAESLKRGLDDVAQMWRTKFKITVRGMRRTLWADDEEDLQNVCTLNIIYFMAGLISLQFKLPVDADACLDKSDFRAAAKELKGSRDLGAQLYCALLRSAGVETRLVCSLQPLSFSPGGPAMPRNSMPKPKMETPEASDEEEAVDIRGPDSPFASVGGTSSSSFPFAARQRLGHPHAADYHMPDISSQARPTPPKSKQKTIHESPYPIFWVEVFDEAHQKWFPVDPLVTATVAKPRSFEPPAADRENNMSYVIAFEEEGSARDVTRRYTKAYNAKTRKVRVECTTGGEKWWKRTMRAYSRGWKSDVDQIEDTELAAAEAREPMPKNIADFKDHPYYALERHLRRNEVLIGNNVVGKVAAGRDPGTPGQKKLESVFRRRDVKDVKSADNWYRLGREIKMGEQPTKVAEPKRRAGDDDLGDDLEEPAGKNLYTEEQTELYEAPPIVNGRVPKNSFGNLDIFVPSMVPKGGVHLPCKYLTSSN